MSNAVFQRLAPRLVALCLCQPYGRLCSFAFESRLNESRCS